MYDAFGNQLNGDETNTNPFRFAGEYYDWETGFIYLRARFYNPALGRFISEDPHWTISNMQSSVEAILQSGNLFVYCGNDPVNRIDPSGLLFVVRGNDGTYRIEAFTSADGWAQFITCLSPAGNVLNYFYQNWRIDGTVVGHFHWAWIGGSSGGGVRFNEVNENTLRHALAQDALMLYFGGAAGKTTLAINALISVVSSGSREVHSEVILGLMAVHGIENSFSSVDDVLDQIAFFNNIIRNRPYYFFLVCSVWGTHYGNLNSSRFLADIALFHMSEEQRSEAFRRNRRISSDDWNRDMFNQSNSMLISRLLREY